MGLPHNEHEVTEANKSTVAVLSASGMTQEKVAAVMKISVPTLMKHYRHEYENGNEMMVAKLLPVSMTVAQDPDHKDSAKDRHFLLERKGGFIRTEKQDLTHGGSVALQPLPWEGMYAQGKGDAKPEPS